MDKNFFKYQRQKALFPDTTNQNATFIV